MKADEEPRGVLAGLRSRAVALLRGSPHLSVGSVKHGVGHIVYELAHRPGRPLVVVFSGTDPEPARCRMSYYSFRDLLDCSVLHIADAFGAHGCYLLSVRRDRSILDTVASIVRKVMDETDTPLEKVHLVGTSKGGTTAVCLALALGGGWCVAGEPQVRLGRYLLCEGWASDPIRASVVYAMTGRLDERDRDYLDKLVLSSVWSRAETFRGHIAILCGRETGYMRDHIRHLVNAVPEASRAPWQLTPLEMVDHAEITTHFRRLMLERFGKPGASAGRAAGQEVSAAPGVES